MHRFVFRPILGVKTKPMELSNDQLQQIVDSVVSRLEKHPPPALAGTVVYLPTEFYTMQREFGERLARVETELVAINGRIEDLIHHFDKRFEQVDKRFEDLIHYMGQRFGQVEKRFVSLQWSIGIGFTIITVLMTIYNFLA